MCTLPKQHPNYQTISACPSPKPKRNESQITKLMCIFKLDPQHTEKITPRLSTLDNPLPFVTRIAESREESILHEQESNATVTIFTDGLGYEGGVGAASVMYTGKNKEPISTLHFHLGNKDNHSMYKAEAIGLLLAVWQIKSLQGQHTSNDKIKIFTDCQSAITSTTEEQSRPGQYLYNSICDISQSLQDHGTHPTKFNINWISAHSNVPGNERVDQEAKKAAQGTTTTSLWLPPILCKPLPTSVLSLHQITKRSQNEDWLASWNKLLRRDKMGLIDNEFPFKLYYKLTNTVDRNSMSLLVQLQTGHFPLHTYFHK